MKSRYLSVFTAIAALIVITQSASAMYHPGLGRFMQRDPNGMQVGPSSISGRPLAAGQGVGARGFIPRDRIAPALQYADGMNLYQYVGSDPVNHSDPSGYKRIIAVLNGQDGLKDRTSPKSRGMLGNAIQGSSWTTDEENNIVKIFEEDADWSSPRASKWIEKQNENGCNTVILVGHSNGGDGARKVAGQLDQTVDLLFLFDPVQKPWRLDGRGPFQTKSVPRNVTTAYNRYQRSDPRRLGGFVPLQGYRISGGTNHLWVPQYSPVDGKGPNKFYAHTEILYNILNLTVLDHLIEQVSIER